MREPRRTHCARTQTTLTVGLLIAVLSCIAMPLHAQVGSRALRVRAQAKLTELGVLPDGDHVVVRGRLVDELGNAVPDARVSVSLGDGSTLSASSCAAGAAPERVAEGFRVAVDDLGTFCLKLDGAAIGLKATFAYKGNDFYDPATVSAVLEPQRARVRLGFDAPVVQVPLERATVPVWVTVHADSSAPFGAPLKILLLHRGGDSDSPVQVAAGDVPTGSRARFDVRTETLGPPGSGTFIARHGGTAVTQPAEATVLSRRTAGVQLSLASQPPQTASGSEVELHLGVTSAVGAVPDGWLEALSNNRPVGTAEVHKGSAELLVPIEGPRSGTAELVVRYIAKDPWWVPGESLAISVPLAAPSVWALLPWLLAVCGIAYWIIRAWRRPGRVAPKSPGAPLPAGEGVAVVAEGGPRAGWTGQILDAHDGTMIARARVQVLLPTFTGEGVAATTIADERGAFTLAPLDEKPPDGARIQVTAEHHTRLSRPLPPSGRVVISMVSRRRSLIDLLVHWAKTRGRPWADAADPTPGDVLSVARKRRESETITWARAVEEAAYGVAAPDESREEDLRRREPRGASGADARGR